MNIVYLTNQFPPNIWGGLGIFVNFLTEQISENNKLWVYTTNSGCLDFFEDKGNVKIYRPIRPFLRGFLQRKKSNGHYTLFSNVVKAVDLLLNNLDCFFLLKENLPHDRYDVIVVHDFMHSLTGLLCKFFLKTPIIFHVHAMEYTTAQERYMRWPISVIRRFFESMLAKNAQSIIVSTEETKELVVQQGWDQSKIDIVPLCNVRDKYETFDICDPDPLDRIRAIKLDLKIKDDDKVIVYIGRLIFLKGTHTLLKAMKHITKEIGDVRLVLVGEGNRRKLTRMVHSLGLDDHIYLYHRFLGYEEVLYHYLMADICIFPSIYEPFGLVALEAMSLGKPVILGDGFSRVFEGVRDTPNVLYVDPLSPEDIASKAVQLLKDEATAMEMGRRARQYIRENFKPNKVVELTLDIYRRAANCS